MPVRGIVRKLGKPVLPGSGWKGAVRARFEAITRSRLGQRSRGGRVEAWKLPAVLRPTGGGKPEVTFTDSRLAGDFDPKMVTRSFRESDDAVREKLARLSPAEALFGAMGYRGRLHLCDGVIEGPAATEPLPVPPLESPAAHRLAKPGAAEVKNGRVEISEVEGRKFYYDGPLVASRSFKGDEDWRPVQERIDCVPANCTITLEVQVESVTEAELGALLVSAGFGENAGILRFGGFKPAGLGKVRLQAVSGDLHRGWSTGKWRRPEGEALDPAQAVAAAHREGLLDTAAMAELHEVTNRLRPGRGNPR
jgi:CRISPR/Cas system CSM-associated protein Csm3 (group 7 of RAMP superfamily)